MATRKSTRARSRKPKTIVIQGHELTPEQFSEYQLEYDRRRAIHIESETQSERHALSSVLCHASAAWQAHQELEKMELYGRASNALSALASLRNGLLYHYTDRRLVELYTAILAHAATEFGLVSQRLTLMKAGIESELADRAVRP